METIILQGDSKVNSKYSLFHPMKIFSTILTLLVLQTSLIAQQSITIDVRSSDKTFEGIGALSAGASSRLLMDYPEKARNEILDWLFKPGYGAAFHHLKVEIGGDVNSTDGTEPSFAHTREEFDHPKKEYFSRGYESWLMVEAKKRNPAIYLDILQWGAPGWIGNGEFFSQDNADYIIRFIGKNKEYFGLDIDYCGVWNERAWSLELPRNNEWIKLLANEIRAHQLKTKIVASDEVMLLNVGYEMVKDTELMAAVDILGTHYQDAKPKNFDTRLVRQIGKPVWSSEDGPWRGDWAGAVSLARKFNRNYLNFGMTKTIIWSLITSYYDVLPLPGSGIMKANTPWSGYYEVQPALWAVAHFTHFIQPGWKYLDAACGFSSDSTCSFTSLVSPDGKDLSIIMETAASKSNFNLKISVGEEFSKREFYLWKSDSVRQFVSIKKINPTKGSINFSFPKGCIYTLTTVINPAVLAVPPILVAKPFPLPYSDDFESYKVEATPRFTQDQSGVFEVKRENGNNILRQVIPGKGIEWHFRFNPDPVTIIGDTLMTDYSVSIDAKLCQSDEYAAVYGRVTRVIQNNIEPPQSYWFRVKGDGTWQLGKTGAVLKQSSLNIANSWPLLQLSFNDHTRNVVRFNYSEISKMDIKTKNLFPELESIVARETNPEFVSLVVYRDGNYYICREDILKSGQAKFDLTKWNNLELRMKGNNLTAFLNSQLMATTIDNSYSCGLAGFGCGWEEVGFDNLLIGEEEK